jgi:hypothetical protein
MHQNEAVAIKVKQGRYPLMVQAKASRRTAGVIRGLARRAVRRIRNLSRHSACVPNSKAVQKQVLNR